VQWLSICFTNALVSGVVVFVVVEAPPHALVSNASESARNASRDGRIPEP
jgi:hypothetical protein